MSCIFVVPRPLKVASHFRLKPMNSFSYGIRVNPPLGLPVCAMFLEMPMVYCGMDTAVCKCLKWKAHMAQMKGPCVNFDTVCREYLNCPTSIYEWVFCVYEGSQASESGKSFWIEAHGLVFTYI